MSPPSLKQMVAAIKSHINVPITDDRNDGL